MTAVPPDHTSLSLHDALPISAGAGRTTVRHSSGARGAARSLRAAAAGSRAPPPRRRAPRARRRGGGARLPAARSEEHTSELQSRLHLVCRLLLEKKKNNISYYHFLLPKSSSKSKIFLCSDHLTHLILKQPNHVSRILSKHLPHYKTMT